MIFLNKKYILSFFLILILPLTNYCLADSLKNLNERGTIYNALDKQGLIHQDIEGVTLVHFVHLCDVIIQQEHYPIIDTIEYIKGAQVPRGAPNILLLDSSLNLIQEISYDGGVRPLYCKGDQLFLYGKIMIDGLLPEGNVITFSDHGKKAVVSYMEPNDFPKQTVLQ